MLKRLRRLMNEHGIDVFAVFMEDPHLSEYTGACDKYIAALSGFTGSAGTLVVEKDEARLWTDSRYYVQADAQLSGSNIKLMKSGMPGVIRPEDYIGDCLAKGLTVSFDKKTLSYAKYRNIAKLVRDCDIKDGSGILHECADLPGRHHENIVYMPDDAAGLGASDKIAKVRSLIRKKYVPSGDYMYVLSDMASIMWLFNLRGSDISYVPVAYSYAIIRDSSAILYVEKGAIDDRSLISSGVFVRDYALFYDDIGKLPDEFAIADIEHNNCEIISSCENHEFIECSDTELIRKAVKNSAEIEGMRRCHIEDAAVMIRFIMRVKEMAENNNLPDEYELGAMLDDMRLEKCPTLSFATICAYGKNAAIVHYTADKDTAKPLEPHGFVLVDSGGQYMFEGTTDITRTISLGPVSKEEKEVYTAVLKGNLRLMDMVFPEGFKGALLDAAAETPLWEKGYYCGHGIGHGVGHYLSVHESEARISRNSAEHECAFHPGVIVSDEPGVYIEGAFGVRLENLLLTVGAGSADGHGMCSFEPLTLVPFDKEAIDASLLTTKEQSILNDYNMLIWEKISPVLDEKERIWLKDYIDIA